MAFQNLRGGDRVRFRMRAGMKIVGTSVVPDYVTRVARVQPMLVFEDHVVVNLGGRYGTPAVVDASNFLGKVGGVS
jgi:hypothetical protein